MALDLNQIKEIIQKPKNRETIRKATLLQQRVRFHTETNVSVFDISNPTGVFLDWVSKLIPKDKFTVFKSLFKFPIPSSSVVEDVYKDLERVFYSRDASSFYQFASSDLLEDWATYRKLKLNEPDVWKTEGWRKMQVSANSILVVDLPVEQTTERPEPYFYWLEISEVIDYELKGISEFNWLIFNQGKDKIAVFDDESIRIYKLNEKREITGLVSEAKHDLGYCPARFFWTSYINEKSKDIKRNPITKELSNLDWYLFFAISKQHLDLYAPYPIYSAYEADCDFKNNETGDYCDGGYLRDSEGNFKMLADGSVEPCPCCSEKRIAGPGSFLEVPIPDKSEGVADLRNPVQITTIDKDSLEYNVTECKRLKNEIIISIVGSGDNVQAREAINETQVAANFESKTSALNALKVNFEQAQKFVEDTICRLRYGTEFIASSLNWGTEFYIFTVEDLYNKYTVAKNAGASSSELAGIMTQIRETEYRSNPSALQRMTILDQLEPYPNLNFNEFMELVDNGLVSSIKALVKINFKEYINRFERENIDIVEFASNKPLREKINIITKKLEDYAKEEHSTIERSKSAGTQRVPGFATPTEEPVVE